MDTMDPLIRAIRRLTVAVWVLCALVAAPLLYRGMESIRLMSRAMRGGVDSVSTTVTRGITVSTDVFDAKRFHDMSPDEQVARSSAILLVSYHKDGERLKAVVAEVLERRPGTELLYSVGNELRELSYYPKSDETRGEGQVVFLLGSPAEFRSSYSFDAGRIGGMGDMPIDVLREMVKRSKS
jgi:hypothetical protein